MGSIILFLVFLASLFLVDYLARERGWKRSRWTLAAVILGPSVDLSSGRGSRRQEND